MVSISLLPSEEIAAELAARARARRLSLNLSLEGMSRRSGVALGTLKKFERTGQISLLSFLRLVVALKDEAALEGLLQPPEYKSLDEVLKTRKTSKRGRIK